MEDDNDSRFVNDYLLSRGICLIEEWVPLEQIYLI
jgi:hypothetical protein